MSQSLGVLFSISQQEVDKLRSLETDEARIAYIAELDEHYFEKDEERLATIEESWDAMQRTLSNGTLDAGSGSFPLSHIVVGGEQLFAGDEYLISLKTPEQVKEIASAMRNMKWGAFRQRYFNIDPAQYPAHSENDFLYTWDHFEDMKPFWAQAAKEGRYVMFTVDR